MRAWCGILCLQISDKGLKVSGETENITEGNIDIDIFSLACEKTGCHEQRFAYLTGTPVRQLSDNHDTDNMRTPTCTACNMSRHTAYSANACDMRGTRQKVLCADRFLCFLQTFQPLTPQTGGICCFIVREPSCFWSKPLQLTVSTAAFQSGDRSLLTTPN